eukprot:UN2753
MPPEAHTSHAACQGERTSTLLQPQVDLIVRGRPSSLQVVVAALVRGARQAEVSGSPSLDITAMGSYTPAGHVVWQWGIRMRKHGVVEHGGCQEGEKRSDVPNNGYTCPVLSSSLLTSLQRMLWKAASRCVDSCSQGSS